MNQVVKSKRREIQCTRVLLVDDHAIVRRGLHDLIDDEDGLSVCAEADSPTEAIQIIDRASPDVAVVDLNYGGNMGLELIKDITARYPDVRVLVLSMYDESDYAERCLRAGALGYIMKQEAPNQIIKAIRRVSEGRNFLSGEMQDRLVDVLLGKQKKVTSMIDLLSDRELEVVELLGQGLTTREVAERLHLSVKTIDSHRSNIMAKLKLANANELIKYAVRWVDRGTNPS